MLGTARDVSEREELRSRLRDLDAVYRFADAVAGAPALDEVLEAALDALLEATGADRASVLLADEEGVLRFRAWRGLSDRYRAYTEGRTPWPADVSDPQPVLVEDVAGAGYEPALERVMRKEGVAALAFVPLVRGGASARQIRALSRRAARLERPRGAPLAHDREPPRFRHRANSGTARGRELARAACAPARSDRAADPDARLRGAAPAGAAARRPAHRRRLPRLPRAQRGDRARPRRARPRGAAPLRSPRQDRRRLRHRGSPAHPRRPGLPHRQADPPAGTEAAAEEGRTTGRRGARPHGVALADRRPARDGWQAARRARGHLGRARPARRRGLRARLGARAPRLPRPRPRRPPPAGAGLARAAAGGDRAAAARRRHHRRRSPHRPAERRGRARLGRTGRRRLRPPGARDRRLAARARARDR